MAKNLNEYIAKGKLGSGQRFATMTKHLSVQKGVYNPKGLAAYIGRKKYGKKKMASLSAHGKMGM